MEITNLIFTIIDVIAAVALATLAVIISKKVHDNEKKDSITTKTVSCLTNLFAEYKATMKMLNKALEQAEKLEKYLDECKYKNDFSTFNSVYYSEEYNNFRDVHYFFEMLGSLMRQDELNKYTFWHYFSFPIDYYQKTRNIRMLITDNNCLPSYGENFNRMFVFYNNRKRKDNKKWIANGKAFNTFDEEELRYYTGYKYNTYDPVEPDHQESMNSKRNKKKEKK